MTNNMEILEHFTPLIMGMLLLIWILIIFILIARIQTLKRREKNKRFGIIEDIKVLERKVKTQEILIYNYKHQLLEIESNLKVNLRFEMDSGEVVHNVKVKTVKNSSNEVVGISSTCRRTVDGKWKDIVLTPKLIS